MPSRPMLTTPARSDHRPPRPASTIGTAAADRGAERCPRRSRSSAPVIDPDERAARAARRASSTTASRSRGQRRARRAAARPAGSASAGGAHAAHLLGRRRGSRAAELRGRPGAARGATPVAADQLVGDDDGEHDDALDDRDDVRARRRPGSAAGCDCSSRNANSSAPKAMPTGLLRPEQRDRDAGEAEPGRERRAVGVGVAEQHAACRPGRRRAPESSIAMTTIRFTLTPLATAAVSDCAGRAQVEAEAGAVRARTSSATPTSDRERR